MTKAFQNTVEFTLTLLLLTMITFEQCLTEIMVPCSNFTSGTRPIGYARDPYKLGSAVAGSHILANRMREHMTDRINRQLPMLQSYVYCLV